MIARLLAILIPFLCSIALVRGYAPRPNVVWIVVEDMSANFGCYGETTIETPNVDRLAAQGLLFERAIATAPICSIFRSALITGMYQTSTGTHHHRSSRGHLKISLPEGVVPVPVLFQEAGYHTSNLSLSNFLESREQFEKAPGSRIAKTDYNFQWDPSMYDLTHWRAREQGQPFFCQVQLKGGKYRGPGNGPNWPARVTTKLGHRTPVASVELPPYLPNDPVIREDWAQYLDTCRVTDWEVGRVLKHLEKAGMLTNTYVFFFTDHGVSHIRNKQFLYDGGVHIPLIVAGPGIKPGTVYPEIIEHIDITAMSLALAGIDIPEWMQGRDVLRSGDPPRTYGFSARDRADETVDHIRSVRSKQFKYIRNFLPERPYLQPNRYKDGKPIIQAMRRLYAAGELNEEQSKIMVETRPLEELYDLVADPHELRNLATNPDYRDTLNKFRSSLDEWMSTTRDQGRKPEPPEMYLSDMKARGYDPDMKPRDEQETILHRNIQQMRAWANEGK